MILCSSIDRLRRYIELPLDSNDDSYDATEFLRNKRLLTNFLYSVTKEIEAYLDRQLELTSRTEYADSNQNIREYFLNAIPISAITSVKSDTTGLYDGSESTLSNYYIGSDSRSIVLDYEALTAPKGIQFVYTGGMAAHGTRTTFVISSLSGTFTDGKFVTGGTSGAVGIIRGTVASGTSLIIDNLYGIFEASENLTSQLTEGGDDIGSTSCTIDSISAQSLAEAYPEIVMACEMEIRFLFKHRDDFEATGVQKEGVTIRRTDTLKTMQAPTIRLQPEVKSMLNKYRRIRF